MDEDQIKSTNDKPALGNRGNQDEGDAQEVDSEKLLKQYKAKIAADFGIDKLPGEEKKKAEDKIDTLVNSRIVNLILIYLPEDKVEEFGKLLEEDPEKASQFAYENISGFSDKLLDELTKIREELASKLKDRI